MISVSLSYTWAKPQTFNGIVSEGSYSANITSTSTSPYTVSSSDEVILVTTGASAFTVTLPASSNSTGRKILIIKADSGAGAITVNRAGTDTIEGATSASISSQYGKLGLVADGVSLWYDLGKGGV